MLALLTLMAIMIFCITVSLTYMHDRIKRMEEVEADDSRRLIRVDNAVSYTSSLVQEIHRKMFAPRQPKEEKPKPKVDPELAAILPTAEDFYQGLKRNIYHPLDIARYETFNLKKEEWHEVAKIAAKGRMTAKDLTDYVMQACKDGLVVIRGTKLFRKRDFRETSKFYFVDAEKKVDGRGKGPRDENGKFIKKYVKPGEPVKSGQTMQVEFSFS